LERGEENPKKDINTPDNGENRSGEGVGGVKRSEFKKRGVYGGSVYKEYL